MINNTKKERCRHCNNYIHGCENEDSHELLDPRKELCDECYLKLNEETEIRMILELDVKIERSSMDEIINYIKSFAEYTTDITTYYLTFRRM